MRRTLALAAVALALTGGAVASPAPALATTPHHVAIVIAGKGDACVAWHSGITGDEILNDVATVRYRNDGLITQIDGTPKNNTADATHYWSYWHNTGSGWKYSTSGPSAYRPAAGTVEGWNFIKGSSTATPPPAHSYASICHDTAVAPPPTAPSTSAPARTPSSPAHRTTASTHPAGTQPVRGITAARADSTAAAPKGSSADRSASSASTVVTSASPAPSIASSTDSLPTLAARDAGNSTTTGSGALPTVLVCVLVVLGGGAAFLARRRRRA